jgi:RHS repeat-associated protein
MIRTGALILAACLVAATASAQQCPPANSSNWCSGLYQYDGTGNIKAIGADTYLYDALGRLTSGTADVQRTGIPSRQTYTYDPFGNRTDVSRDAGSVNCVGGCEIPVVVSTLTNHITSNSAHYDEAGNLDFIQATVGNTSYPATYTYDAAGSLAHANSTDNREFIYTADDERVATKNGVTWTWTLRGADNKVLRDYMSIELNGLPTASLRWAKDYVWRDGVMLASVVPASPGSTTSLVQHYHVDHLGTPRVVTTIAGVVNGIHAYYPSGAELDLAPHESNVEKMKFTGHERDLLPGGPLTIDSMHARYYMASLGKFLSVDPVLGRPTAPQSWNRYAYVLNNPLSRTDPTGKECERKDGHRCGDDELRNGEDVDTNHYGLFGSSKLLNVTKIDKVMTATLGLINNIGITLLATLAPGLEGPGKATAAKTGVRLTEKGLAMVERHLLRFGEDKANAAMVGRLRSALETGSKVAGADANFYLHELAEGAAMDSGMSYDAAHAAALEHYGVSNFSLYAPEVIDGLPELFNSAWRQYWGLP